MTTDPDVLKIIDVRKHRGYSQEYMANALGFHDHKDYGRIETGEKKLTTELFALIARVLGMSPAGLMRVDIDTYLEWCNTLAARRPFETLDAMIQAEMKDGPVIGRLRADVMELREQLRQLRAGAPEQ